MISLLTVFGVEGCVGNRYVHFYPGENSLGSNYGGGHTPLPLNLLNNYFSKSLDL